MTGNQLQKNLKSNFNKDLLWKKLQISKLKFLHKKVKKMEFIMRSNKLKNRDQNNSNLLNNQLAKGSKIF